MAVRDLLLKHELVQLYTNRNDEKLKAEAEKNAELMGSRFRNSGLPLYVILEPTKEGYTEVARTNGLLEVGSFLDFLGPPKTLDRIELEVFVTPPAVKPGQTVQLTIRGKPKAGFRTYPITERAPKQPADQLSLLTVIDTDDIRPIWPIRETEPEWEKDPQGSVFLEHKKPFEWTQDVFISEEAKSGETALAFSVKSQVSDEKHTVVGTQY